MFFLVYFDHKVFIIIYLHQISATLFLLKDFMKLHDRYIAFNIFNQRVARYDECLSVGVVYHWKNISCLNYLVQ